MTVKACKCWLASQTAHFLGTMAGISQAGERCSGWEEGSPTEAFIMEQITSSLSAFTACLLGIKKVQTFLPGSRKLKKKKPE